MDARPADPTVPESRRRPRRQSLKKAPRNNPDTNDTTTSEPPVFFGQVAIQAAPISFSRDRKSSTGAVNADRKFRAPALQAAMKSTASLAENNGCHSTVNVAESTSSLENQPSTGRSGQAFFSRNRKRSSGSGPQPSAAEFLSPSVGNHPEGSSEVFRFSRNGQRSSGAGDVQPIRKNSSKGTRGVFLFPRNRKRSNGPAVPAVGVASSSSVGGSDPDGNTPFPRNRKSSMQRQFSPSIVGNPSESLAKLMFPFARSRKSSNAPGNGINNNDSLTTGHSAMKSTASLLPSEDAARPRRVSFLRSFTKNRSRSYNTSVESSSSPAHNTPEGPSTFVNLFKSPIVASSNAPTTGFRIDTVQANPDTSERVDPVGPRASNPERLQKVETDTNLIFGNVRNSHISPKEPMKRKKSTRFRRSKQTPGDTAVSSEPLLPSPSITLNPHAPEFIPAVQHVADKNEVSGTATMPNDTAEPSSSTTCAEENVTRESRIEAANDGTGITVSPSSPPQAAVTCQDITGTRSTDCLEEPKVDQRAIYIPPHRRRESSEIGIFSKSISTIPFPASRNEPECEPEIKNYTAVEEETPKLAADSKYWIYENLFGVLWTETKLRNNPRIRQELLKCSASRSGSDILELPSDIAFLLSVSDSQRHLLEIASAMSLSEDAKISEALSKDKKNIKNRLILSQDTILAAAKNIHSLLDLVQEVVSNIREQSSDPSPDRLIVKLCFSCGKLPSSLCIQGVE
ncbi:hypothetical protein C8R45DRAFT_536445 [Mycena sanguinolenta]|nr:hypothetical protein C8R45DRAFT_536445 [Mycena sanguinolenta]